MNLTAFQASLAHPDPPLGLAPLVAALWWDAHGDWDRAHSIAQDIETPEGAWVHAYLHRREGDAVNARYWYRRAAKPPCRDSLETEHQAIVAELLRKV